MENETKSRKILETLQKMKALYEDAKRINNEGEAEAAAAMINKLLIKYNLTMEDIGEHKEESEIVKDTIRGDNYAMRGWWEAELTNVLCRYNLCQSLTYGRHYDRIIIVGKKENVEIVKWMKETLADRYVSISKIRYKQYKEKVYSGEIDCYEMPTLHRYQRAYLMGVCRGLSAKLEEIKKQNEQKYNEQITALVVNNKAALQKFYDQQGWNLGKGYRYNRTSCSDATRKGYSDGYKANVNRPLSGKSKTSGYIGG